jgi:glyoxylase-like metal-dependent hydrolase (beta-lactamase superfamily II)
MSITRLSRFGFVNCYLVQEDDGLTLVDTLIPGNAKKILAAAEKMQAPIVRIVLTHAHGDHIGSLDALAEALPDAEVLISARRPHLLARSHQGSGSARWRFRTRAGTRRARWRCSTCATGRCCAATATPRWAEWRRRRA